MSIQINQAYFGLATGNVTQDSAQVMWDVTWQAQQLYASGTRTFSASRDQWGCDPDYGKPKALYMAWFDEQGLSKGAVCAEGKGNITLPG
jgi:hypothetical protein